MIGRGTGNSSPKPSASLRPDLVGIGAQKCASSWIHAVLGAHPQVGIAEPKELDFFSYHFDRGYRWYEAHFARHNSKEVRFESSPSYFHDPRSPARLRAYRPDMRILVLLRDPVERAYSNHLHEVIKGHVPPMTFEEGLENNPAYLEQGMYADHLGRWLDHFPREQIRVMIAEDIAQDPLAAAADLYRFAGIDASIRPGVLAERRNESDRPRLPLLRRALRWQGDLMRRAGLEETLLAVKRLRPVAGLLRYNSVDLRGELPAMHEETRARLMDLFADQTLALAPLLGRDGLPWPTWAHAAGSRDQCFSKSGP